MRGMMVFVIGAVGCGGQPAPVHRESVTAAGRAAAPTVADQGCQRGFVDVTAETGISFRHTDGGQGDHYIVEVMSAGLALFDYDGDGDIDIYFPNGALQPRLPGADGLSSPDPSVGHVLYRNEGNWKFTDVTRQARLGHTGHGLGVTVGDYDNDGDPDIYLNNFGPNVLYRNNGDGTFSDVTAEAGVAHGERVGAGVSFLDCDADGDLDLFTASYVRFTHEKHVPRTSQGYPIYGGPTDYEWEPNALYRNNGDGTFTDVSIPSGIAAHAGPGMGICCADYDRDGDTDIFVANDGQANFLFENDGRGKFEEVGLLRGFAYDAAGKVHASMGVDIADYNRDGYPDVHVTSFQGEVATLYRNVGGTLLEDVTHPSGAGRGTLLPVTWGNAFGDFDNDGDRDIFIACGHLNEHVSQYDPTTTYHQPNLILENIDGEKFANVADRWGSGMQVSLTSRGAGIDDLDNDGDLDIVVLNARREPTILRNELVSDHHWLSIQLRGTITNRDGVGARVEVTAGGRTQADEVHSGRGYQGHHGSRLHFGLGASTRAEQIRVHWLRGGVQLLRDVPVDQTITIEESPTAQPAQTD